MKILGKFTLTIFFLLGLETNHIHGLENPHEDHHQEVESHQCIKCFRVLYGLSNSLNQVDYQLQKPIQIYKHASHPIFEKVIVENFYLAQRPRGPPTKLL